MDAGKGLPGRQGPADGARLVPRSLGILPERPGRGEAGGRGAAPGGTGRGGVRGEANSCDSPVFAGLGAFPVHCSAQVTAPACPRPARARRGNAAPGEGPVASRGSGGAGS